MSKVEVEVKEVQDIYLLFERLQEFMHQPMNFENPEQVREFISSVYPDVRDAYYHKVWGWLPDNIQNEILKK